MSFLQPVLLLILPLVGLPIVIHLIHQRRYQAMPWGAMQFLLKATRMSRGLARLRRWLILLMRMLVIGTLVLAVSRPLTSGWFSLAGRADTTLLIIDRSPSMLQQVAGEPKLAIATRQIVRTLQTTGSAHWIVIDQDTQVPREIDSPDQLQVLLSQGPSSASANLPNLLQIARDYIASNQTGRTEIWIASDCRANDWQPESNHWKRLRGEFLKFSQSIRFHLLALSQVGSDNLAVRVTRQRKTITEEGPMLSLSLSFTREDLGDNIKASETVQTLPPHEGPSGRTTSLPVQIELNGARSELMVEMAGPRQVLEDYRIALSERTGEDRAERGWGHISIPADSNQADNDFYFVYDTPPTRKTIVVSEGTRQASRLKLAASISPNLGHTSQVETVARNQLATTPWEEVALLLWQASLPVNQEARIVQNFVEQGGEVLFLPPREPTDTAWMGVQWKQWNEKPGAIAHWRGDAGLLATTQSGTPLPVQQLVMQRHCNLAGEVTPLATLDGGAPLLARVSNRSQRVHSGGVHFLATTPQDSNLVSQGVLWYVLIQRALSEGIKRLENTRNLIAGETPHPGNPNTVPEEGVSRLAERPASWLPVAGHPNALSSNYANQQGVYSAGEKLLSVNRPPSEDHASILTSSQINALFQGLNFVQIDSSPNREGGLIEEVWRLFLILALVAMFVEALLSLPNSQRGLSNKQKELSGQQQDRTVSPSQPGFSSRPASPGART